MSPEARAREKIDALLLAAGWVIQDYMLDIFWLKGEALEDSANLPAPGVIAADIVADLEAALEQFAAIEEDLKS